MKTSTLTIAGLLVATSALACTKTVMLREDQPLMVTAQAPKPPPPPPPPPPKRVEVKKEKIQVNEKIHFEFDSAEIKEDSHDLLNEIASVINQHPELVKIRIEGHTDNVGTAKYNLDLSKRRAKAVLDYLVNTGKVDPTRLESDGYGFTKPIADNSTDEGRAQNRRVEFNILERSGETPEEAPATDAGGTPAPSGTPAATPAPSDKTAPSDKAAPSDKPAPAATPAPSPGTADTKKTDDAKPAAGGAQ